MRKEARKIKEASIHRWWLKMECDGGFESLAFKNIVLGKTRVHFKWVGKPSLPSNCITQLFGGEVSASVCCPADSRYTIP
jgi:hypothetical protein